MRHLEETKNYWSTRSEGYTKTITPDFEGERKAFWLDTINLYRPEGACLKILDAGCGPGYFTVLLAMEGHQITAVDYTPQMLEETGKNAREFGVIRNVTLLRQDIQNLEFKDNSFDMVISRNVTWTLDDPAEAYREWLRVLKPGGRFLNFDSNFLFAKYDVALQEQYKRDEQEAIKLGYVPVPDDHLADGMDVVLPKLASAKHCRPEWDMQLLAGMKCSKVMLDKTIHEPQQKGSYLAILGKSNQRFLICVEK